MSNYAIPENLKKYFDETLPSTLEKYHIPGASVAVVKDNEIVYMNGFGYRDLEQKIEVDNDTVFAIGSTSKAFTAVVLGSLVDDGKLGWNDLVIDYIPEFRMKDPVATVQMTIKDIMCHRCGMSRHDLGWFFSNDTRSELLAKIQYLEPFAPFRSAFYYNNWMWMVAGIVGERITGKTWEQNVQERIFDPLGMKNSNCSVDEMKKMSNFALPYEFANDRIKEIPFHNIDAIGPAGSINANIIDYAKWLHMNLNMGTLNGEKVISSESLSEIFAPQMAIDKDNDLVQGLTMHKEFSNLVYTLGWVSQHYRGHQMLQHAGGIDGFSSFISMLPDQNLGVAVLTNLQGTNYHYGINWEIADRMLGLDPVDWTGRIAGFTQDMEKMMKEQEKALLSAKVPDTKPSHTMDAYCGKFCHTGYGCLEINEDNGQLVGKYNHIPVTISHFHYDVFQMHLEIPSPEVTIPIRFNTDLMGAVDKIYIPFDEQVAEIEFTRNG